MIQTVEAVIGEEGRVRLLGDLNVTSPRRAFVIVLDEPAAVPSDAALLTESALSLDWHRPEEDVAWSHLQPRSATARLRRYSVPQELRNDEIRIGEILAET